ncbi:MAG: hypothetical protein ACXVNM_06325 [Bacteroidia bacterium]
MTLTQFLTIYKFEFEGHILGNETYVAITKVILRADNRVVDRIKTSIDIFETNDWIAASQSAFSLIEWDWNKIIDQTKRGQLDYYAQRIPITDFFPVNSQTDIRAVYI